MNQLSEILKKINLPTSSQVDSNCNPEQFKVNSYNKLEDPPDKYYNCPKCKNKELIAVLDEDGKFTTILCDCKSIRQSIKRAEKSGLKMQLDGKTINSFTTTEKWQEGIKFKTTEYIDKHNGSWFYIGGQKGCVDCDTEYFNGREWVKISEYKVGDKVLQYNPKNEKATLTIPSEYIQYEADSLYHFASKSNGIDMCLSLDHNFAYVTSKGHMQKKPFAEVLKMHEETTQGFYGKVQTAFKYSGKGIDLTDDEIRLMCAVIADGHFRNGLRLCIVNVKKERKKERMRMLLSGVSYKEYEKKNGYSEFRFYAPRREKEFTEYWYNCNRHQMKIIVDEVFNWDGHKDGKRKSFFSNSKKSADFIQFAISSTGSRATLSVENHRKNPCYVVIKSSFSSKVNLCSSGGVCKTKAQEVKTKDGYQYCFTVETGYLILRRNGRIFVTGNCGKSHICTAIVGEFINQGKDALYMLWRDKVVELKANVNNFEEYDKLMQELKSVDVLYIDDFYKTDSENKPTQADKNIAFELLNYRYNNPDCITIISTELQMNELLSIDEAVGSRIYERSKGYQINIAPDIKKNYRLR